MAKKRMFNNDVLDTDSFLDLPLSAQALYFHLNLRADDDGFISNPKRVQTYIGASEDDLKLLVMKRFVIAFDDGVIVIKHWRMHNTLRADRYNPTIYQEDFQMLGLKENKAYTLDGNQMATIGIPSASTDIGIDIGKDIDKESKHKHGAYAHVLLTDSELDKLKKDFGEQETEDAITFLDEYIEMKGTKYKSHYLALRKWVFDAVKEKKQGKGASSKPKKSFANFNQRDYDFDALEAKLLNT